MFVTIQFKKSIPAGQGLGGSGWLQLSHRGLGGVKLSGTGGAGGCNSTTALNFSMPQRRVRPWGKVIAARSARGRRKADTAGRGRSGSPRAPLSQRWLKIRVELGVKPRWGCGARALAGSGVPEHPPQPFGGAEGCGDDVQAGCCWEGGREGGRWHQPPQQ